VPRLTRLGRSLGNGVNRRWRRRGGVRRLGWAAGASGLGRRGHRAAYVLGRGLRVGRGLGPGQRGRRRAVGGVVGRVGYLGARVIVVGRVTGAIVVAGVNRGRDADRGAVIGG
jgi:hypothetical protein